MRNMACQQVSDVVSGEMSSTIDTSVMGDGQLAGILPVYITGHVQVELNLDALRGGQGASRWLLDGLHDEILN